MSAAPSPSEARTRRDRIDPQLAARGWAVRPGDPPPAPLPGDPVALTEYPTASGPADYALCDVGRVVGVVEAKKLAVGPQAALDQADRYADGLDPGPLPPGGTPAPFRYSTNGELIYFRDARDPLGLTGWPFSSSQISCPDLVSS